MGLCLFEEGAVSPGATDRQPVELRLPLRPFSSPSVCPSV